MSRIVFEKDFSHHPLHYFVLLVTQLVGLWGIFWFQFKPSLQALVLFYMAATYVMWGIVHHKHHRNLHFKIVLEYILYAFLGLLLVGSLILRA